MRSGQASDLAELFSVLSFLSTIEMNPPGLCTCDRQVIGGHWSLLGRAVSVASVLNSKAGSFLGDGTSHSWIVGLVSEAGGHVMASLRHWRELSILEVTAALEILL